MRPSKTNDGFEKHLRSYFRSKRGQLLADVSAAGAPHSGHAGSHREALIRDYLRAILPRRLEIGRGIVFGLGSRSREADVVLWDVDNYPCLRLTDHQLFFAESARVVLEAKSRWSSQKFADILDKCRSVRDIIPMHTTNLADDIAMLQMQVHALGEGLLHEGMLINKPRVGTGAFIFAGGQLVDAASVEPAWIEQADDSWPDVMILLEPGIVVRKQYVTDGRPLVGSGHLEFLRAGEDSLLVYSASLMGLINERCVQIEDPSYLLMYIQQTLHEIETQIVEFRLSRAAPGRW